jgi:hypothetical protein
MTERGERDRKLQTKPCWSWSGAEALDFARQTQDLERLVAMLPEKKSSADEILNFLVDLRARFQRWMHQDEFGPTRRQQTAALRALKKSLQILQGQLAKGATSQREQLDTMLRAGNHLSATVLERLYEGADDLECNLRTSGASGREIDWALRVKCLAEKTMAQSQSLDTNTDGEILPIANQHGFDSYQTYPADFSLATAEQWLNACWNVVDQALCELNKKRGAEERVSLKLLVEQLCEFWERETACQVTAHGMSKLEYTQRTETDAGRFVTAATEAMLPESAWFNEHSGFSHVVRARTFLPSRQRDRARQILVIMRDFVRRRSDIQENALPKKSAFNSVNAVSATAAVPTQDGEKRLPEEAASGPDVDPTRKLSPAHFGDADD